MMSEMAMMAQHPVMAISFLSLLFIFIIGIAAAAILIIFLIDKFQQKDAIRHNYPVLARLRDSLQNGSINSIPQFLISRILKSHELRHFLVLQAAMGLVPFDPNLAQQDVWMNYDLAEIVPLKF